jgi:hypothetical protein
VKDESFIAVVHHQRLAAAFAVVTLAIEPVLDSQVTHSLHGAAAAPAPLHCNIAQLVHAQQRAAAMAKRPRNKNS